MTNYTSPEFEKTAFNCPLCGAYAEQEWLMTIGLNKNNAMFGRPTPQHSIDSVEFALCSHCKNYSVWLGNKMIYPSSGNVPLPNSDMPIEIKNDYEEARSIVNSSPRGAVALLRLAVQKLCKHLGEKGENINTDIANLVKKGLPEKLQKALDSVRVIGNNAVHPGQININDDIELAYKLFGFINIICDIMITQPNQIDTFYEFKIPEQAKESINKRDGK